MDKVQRIYVEIAGVSISPEGGVPYYFASGVQSYALAPYEDPFRSATPCWLA